MTLHRFDLDRIGAGLIVSGAREELLSGVASGALTVVAPPGTGKTTFIPPFIANLLAEQGNQGRVLLTQPRRVAARAAARRIAALDGSTVGETIGFTVRGERTISDIARIEVVTPGVLLRRLLSDPGLDGVSCVILDEVHERSLDGDVLLSMIAEVRELRDDLTVVAMSATLDAAAVSTLLAGPTVNIPSALHPLHIEYQPAPGPRFDERGIPRAFLSHLASVAFTGQATHNCDALVFVPGAREATETVRLIRELADNAPAVSPLEVLALHGQVSSTEQDRAVSGRGPKDPPRIIVSTSLAESSLTVPGVQLVIDAGLSREVRRDRARDMIGLVTVSSSQSSAEQRAGRAARLGPGHAIRVYSETDFARMPAHAAPEIRSADLTDTALLLAAWGAPGGTGMRFITPPPPNALANAIAVLQTLELIDDDGRVTPQGARVATLPIGAREARALIIGAGILRDAALAAEIVAAMSGGFRTANADLTRMLRELRSGRMPGSDRWRRECKRLASIAKSAPVALDSPLLGSEPLPADTTAPGVVAALARPEWVAKRTGLHSRTYLLASGTRAALPEGSELRESEWIAVHEVQRASGPSTEGTGAIIRLAAAIRQDEALTIARTAEVRERLATVEGGKVRVREERRLGAIVLSSAPASPQAEDTSRAFANHVRDHGLEALTWDDSARALRARLAFLRREFGDPWPAVDDNALLQNLSQWVGPDLDQLTPTSTLHAIDVRAALSRLLPWPEAARLDELAPERMRIPSGSSARIDYPAPDVPDGRPVIAVKLQELFGLNETPRVAGGRAPILFHLLSPARRPLAVTDDLASFWEGPYQAVRKEMRGRYPKHPWPEDPWTAEATAGTKHKKTPK